MATYLTHFQPIAINCSPLSISITIIEWDQSGVCILVWETGIRFSNWMHLVSFIADGAKESRIDVSSLSKDNIKFMMAIYLYDWNLRAITWDIVKDPNTSFLISGQCQLPWKYWSHDLSGTKFEAMGGIPTQCLLGTFLCFILGFPLKFK